MDTRDYDYRSETGERTTTNVAVDRMKTDYKTVSSTKKSSDTKSSKKKDSYLPEGTSELSSIEESKYKSSTSTSHKGSSSKKTSTSTSSESSVKYMTKEEQTESLRKRKKEIKSLFDIISSSEKIDLVFLCDCTGSMSSWIHGIKESIYGLNQRLKNTYQNLSIRTAFVGYTDFDMQEELRTRVLQFTESRSEFKDFVGSIEARGGGDEPEDIFSGLEKVISLDWRQGGTRVVIHIGDAPCHGERFHDPSMHDDHPKSDPLGRTADEIFRKISEKGINYFFGYILPTKTNQMIDEFNNILKKVGSQHQIIQFDSKDPSSITESSYLAVTQSVRATISGMSEGKKRTLRDYKLSPEIPMWSSIPQIKCKVSKFQLPDKIEDVIAFGSTLKLKDLTISFKVAPNPFAEGATRIAYHAFNVEHSKEVVLKESKWLGGRSNSLKAYLEEMQTQTVSALFAKTFNEECKTPFKINFAVAKVIQMKETSTPKYMALEPLIKGEYKKFNNNGGWFADNEFGKILNAFSHWTFKKSKRTMMVVDLQGVSSGKDFFLTDPAIHSRDILRFGKTNLGKPGMKRFFKTHVCNDYCKKLGIQNFLLEEEK